MPRYAPDSRILIVTICSFNKAAGGEPDYDKAESILTNLPEAAKGGLLKVRRRVRRIITKTEEIDWGGVALPELEFNNRLVEGADFGGDAPALYFPAVRRYEGRFFQTLGLEGKRRLFNSHHHVLLLSGLYGVLRPFEPIQLYACPLKAPIALEWRKSDVLTTALDEYARQHRIERVLDLTAVAAYRDLIDWDAFSSHTGASLLHAFDTMGMGDNALVPFGRLTRDVLLDAPEDTLLNIASERRFGTVTFRSLNETPAGLPDEQRALHRAEMELPLLGAFSTRHLDEVMQGGNPLPGADQQDQTALGPDEWQFTVSTDFRKHVNAMDRTMQGRIMAAILEIGRAPQLARGDTVKPLTEALAGQWRYRLGDYRLVYRPDEARRVVSLLEFGPRNDDEVYRRSNPV